MCKIAVSAWVVCGFLVGASVPASAVSRTSSVLPASPHGDSTTPEPALVTPHDFNYIINNKTICVSDRHLLYVVYVVSAVGHFDKRTHIRQTWGYDGILKQSAGKVIFILGATQDAGIQNAVAEENRKHGDIIQMDFIDSYLNLTIKSVMALRWVRDFCQNAEFVMKSDDDTLVNIVGLARFLEKIVRPSKRTFFCYVWEYSLVEREGKWKISYKQFGEERYPLACNGPFYIIPKAQIDQIYQKSFVVPYIPVEDQYTTGLLARALGDMLHVSPPGFETYPWGLPLHRYADVTVLPPLISVPNNQIYLQSWKIIIDRLSARSKTLISHKYLQYFNVTF